MSVMNDAHLWQRTLGSCVLFHTIRMFLKWTKKSGYYGTKSWKFLFSHKPHFSTQYCDITIKRYCNKETFFPIFVWIENIFFLSKNMLVWSATPIFGQKNYLFISMSLYRNIVPKNVVSDEGLTWNHDRALMTEH